MTKKAYYIGMDVHKTSVQMAVFEETGDDPIYERRLDNDTALLVKEAVRFSREGKTEVAYEAGCLGYVLQRAMAKVGITCHVLPANKVAKKRTERIKTDKRDARLIGRELRSRTIRPIAVPDETDEAARDLQRCREDVSEDLRRMKQRRRNSPASAIEAADRALHRLHKKYIRLLMKGKHKNVAVTAVARELAGFIWAVQVSA
jgi:transposase